MPISHPIQSSTITGAHAREEDKDETNQMFQQLVATLPRESGWISAYIHKYQGFWYSTPILKGVLNLQQHFRAQPGDVLLINYPKSGTTWIKALMFTIINRKRFSDLQNPLLKANPHELVTFLEAYATNNPTDPRPSSSLMQTHIPYSSLPDSVKTSGCRIVYAFRDPKDVLVSCWHFIKKIRPEELPPFSLAEAFEQFAQGASPYGPYWDHVMGYWKARIECPESFLFLSYEELKKDPCFHARRLAQFLGNAFSAKEEKDGLVSKIVQFCSFENMVNLEVNKVGTHFAFKEMENKIFFRQGKVGDAKNHLSEEMMLILDGITEEKLKDIKNSNPKDENLVDGLVSPGKEETSVAGEISTRRMNAI